jgi:hypothetical protein
VAQPCTACDSRSVPVRRATSADVDAVVRTLVDSHLDYAWEAWALDGVDRRARLTRLVRAFIELVAIPSREAWMHSTICPPARPRHG